MIITYRRFIMKVLYLGYMNCNDVNIIVEIKLDPGKLYKYETTANVKDEFERMCYRSNNRLRAFNYLKQHSKLVE
jgi:hypothetical protein